MSTQVYEEWQWRLLEERQQLLDRLNKLNIFFIRPTKDIEARALALMRDQQVVMTRYLIVLNLRIELFDGPL